MDTKNTKRMGELLAERLLAGEANIEYARLLAERSGDPSLLDAFRKMGYRVTRIRDPKSEPHEVERQMRFGEAARRLGETPVSELPAPKEFDERYVRRLFDKAESGSIDAARDAAELLDGPAEWLIEEKED